MASRWSLGSSSNRSFELAERSDAEGGGVELGCVAADEVVQCELGEV